MLTFGHLLEAAGIASKGVLLIRHSPKDPAMRAALPWIVAERPDLFLAWQRIQWRTAQAAMTKTHWIAAFLAQEGGHATFAGFSKVQGWEPLAAADYWDFPGMAELGKIGVLAGPQGDDILAFDLVPQPVCQELIGRLVVGWPPPDRSWFRWAANGNFPISSIETESRFAPAMPAWAEISLRWPELHLLPLSWRTALAQWRGVYFIFDEARRAGYVGSAYGKENILGRWLTYAATGHGANKQLRDSRPEDLRFSILQRTSPDSDPSEVIALESSWKSRLYTREFGLNSN